jgi:sporulation protein YlmC with PRC-barrel domain
MTFRKVVKASEITGVDVKNMKDENLGNINDVVIDKSTGKVSYLVLDFGGFMGFGNKFFAVPWDQFTYHEGKDCFVLNLDEKQLKNAPGFDKDNWPNFTSREVASSIEQFYPKNKKDI